MQEENHRVLQGDCLAQLRTIPSESVDLVFTDPPYNQGIKYIKKDFKDRKKPMEYVSWLEERLVEICRVLKKTGSMYLINYPEWNARVLPFLENKLKMKLQRWIVWHYPTNIGISKRNWTRSHRSVLFLTKGKKYTFNREEIIQPYKNPEVGKIKRRIQEGYRGRAAYDSLTMKDLFEILEMREAPSDFIEINMLKNVRKERKKWHNCQLPPELIDIFVRVSSNPGDVVLDPFAGTFSTSMIAKQIGRRSIGIEVSKRYVRWGKARLNT